MLFRSAGLLGLWIELDKFGESHNMVIDDLYVHDVYGSTVIEKGGGIGICIQNGRDNDSILSRFVGMTIENCYLKDCQRDGIKFKGYWIRKQWNPNLGVVIRRNVLDGVPGDGIVLAGCDEVYNLVGKNSALCRLGHCSTSFFV